MVKIDRSLDYVCPLCRARVGKRCVLTTGAYRKDSHRERKDIAIEQKIALRAAGLNLPASNLSAALHIDDVKAPPRKAL